MLNKPLTDNEHLMGSLQLVMSIMNKISYSHDIECTFIAKRRNGSTIVIGNEDTLSRLPNKQEVIEK